MSASRLLRVAVAVGLTAIVLYNANPSAVLSAAAHAHVGWIALALLLVLADRTLMALRWIDLLGALTPGSRPATSIVLRIFFASSFVSNFVPGVAADMYRAYALARHDVRLAESTASVLMDRILGVLSMALVGAAALPFAATVDDTTSLLAGLGLAFGVSAAAGAVVFSRGIAAQVVRVSERLPFGRLRRFTLSVMEAVRRYADDRQALVRVLLMSVLVQAARVLQAWCLGRSLGIDLPLPVYFAFLPVIMLVMQLPITINGFGTTQYAFHSLFVPAGAPAAHVFALSILFLALGVAGSLPGGLIYAASRREPAPGGSRL